MNLMFWKKKADAGEEAANSRGAPANAGAREPLDFSATQQDMAEDNREPSEPELPGGEAGNLNRTATPPRLAARMKLWFVALQRHFQKPPEFRADENQAQAESGNSNAYPEATLEEEPGEEASAIKPVRSRKWLIMGGAAGLLAVLLAGIVIANWPASDSSLEVEPSEKQEGAEHAAVPHATQPAAPALDGHQAEIEVLEKEKAGLQAQVEALKRQLAQRPAPPPKSARNAPPSSARSEVTVGGDDPKSTAMTLKEAIEAMNAGSGDYNKKPVK